MTYLPAICMLFPGGCINDTLVQGMHRTPVICLMDAQGRFGMLYGPWDDA
jgi:hypothetical protein